MIQKVKYTYDILPDEFKDFEKVENLFRHFLDLYGYKEMKTPVFEHTQVFTKENDTSDVVTKEMYTFSMNDKDSLTLRPEGTPGIIRSFVENKMYGSNELPVKLAYIEEMFRYERGQKGRQRQFTQMGIECLGDKSPLIDAETIALGYFYLKTLGITQIKVLVNSLGDASSREKYREALIKYFEPHLNELCTDCQNRLYKNPLRILDCKVDNGLDIIKNALKISDYLNEESKEYFNKFLSYLNILEIPYEVSDNLVRGLDYYTDTVFEVVSTSEESGSQATIFGGGRYDKLVKAMDGPDISGIGFAIGVERLLILLNAENLIEEKKEESDIYVINLDEDFSYALKITELMRNNSYVTEMNYYPRTLKSQFKSSDRKNAKLVFIIGEDEIKNKTVTVKNTLDKTQNTIKYEELVDFVDSILGGEYE